MVLSKITILFSIFLFPVKTVTVSNSDFLTDKTCQLSYQLIYDGGFFKSIYGLGKSTTNNTIENIDFGFFTAGNSLAIIEKGLVKRLFGTYQSGDLFIIEIIDSVTFYYRNDKIYLQFVFD